MTNFSTLMEKWMVFYLNWLLVLNFVILSIPASYITIYKSLDVYA